VEKIYFVSAVPGAGKTYWAINKILEQAAKKNSIVMYVAPTHQLLKEVFNALRAKGPEDLRATIISHGYFKGAVQSLMAKLVGGARGYNNRHARVRLGAVILLTHEAFIRIPVIPRSEEIVVFFDEARKLVTTANVKTNETIFEKIGEKQILTLEKMQNSSFFKVHSELSSSTLNRLKRLANTKNMYSINLAIRANNKRVEIFVDKYARNIFEVVLPSKMFQGFKKVCLLGADFENSQMRHILENENFELVRLPANISKEREKLLFGRYKNTVIYPLASTDKPISKYALAGVMVKDTSKQVLLEKIIKAGSTVREEATIVNNHDNDTLKDDLETSIVWKYYKKGLVITNVFAYYYDSAVSAAKKLDGLQECDFFKQRPLLVANKGYGAEYKKDRDFPDNADYAEEDQRNTGLSTIRLPGNPQGLNGFMKHSTMIYLMAVNPPPPLIKFLRAYLPNYSYEKDYAGSNALQAVTRTSIRDVKSTKTVRIIVSDFGVARIIKGMLGDAPTISPKFVGDFVPLLGDSKPRELKDPEEVAKNQVAAKKRWREQNRELSALIAKLYRLERSGRKGKIYEHQLNMLKDQIQVIKQKKSEV